MSFSKSADGRNESRDISNASIFVVLSYLVKPITEKSIAELSL